MAMLLGMCEMGMLRWLRYSGLVGSLHIQWKCGITSYLEEILQSFLAKKYTLNSLLGEKKTMYLYTIVDMHSICMYPEKEPEMI